MDIQKQLGNTVIMITHDVDEAVLLSDRIVMMTNGPAASIGEVLSVDLPRPRDRVLLADDADFNNYRQQVLRLYENKKILLRKTLKLHKEQLHKKQLHKK